MSVFFCMSKAGGLPDRGVKLRAWHGMRLMARTSMEIFWNPDRKTDSVMVHCWLCPGGGIGRRARFRSVYRKMWRFEFSPGHQIHQIQRKLVQKRPLPTQWPFCFPGAFSALGPPPSGRAQTGTATRSWPCVPTIRALVNSPTLSVLLIFSGGSNFTTPSISGASA